MKKITIYLVMLLMGFSGYSQVENFDNPSVVAPVTPGPWVLPSGTWQIFDNGVGPNVNWTLNPQEVYPAYSGTKAAFMNRMNIGAGNTSEDYLVTPLLTVQDNQQLRFFTRTTIAGQAPPGTLYQIRSAPATADPTLPASFTTIVAQWTENELTEVFDEYEEKVLDITEPVNTQLYYAFVRVNSQPDLAPTGDRWLVDDFKFVSKCLDVTNIVPACLATSASLSWTSPGGATQWAIHVLPADAEFDPSVGTPIIANTNTNFVVDQVTQPVAGPMLPLTEYAFYIQALCENSPSEWVMVTCTTQPLPPVCGGSYVDNGGVDQPYLPNSNETITICPESTNPDYQVTVTFTSFNTETGYDALYVYDGNSTNASLLPSQNGPGNTTALATPGAWWGTVIPGPFTSSSPDGCLTFQFISDGIVQNPGFTANVTCNPPPVCPKPGSLAVAVTSTTATLTWTNIGPGTSWEVIALPCGAPAPNAATVGTTTTNQSYTFDPLEPGTCYSFYVRANCESTGNGLSDWNGPISDQTNVLPPVCGGNYVDNGGLSGNYAANSDDVVVICPEDGEFVTVTFTEFNTAFAEDGIYVYNGDSTSAPLIPSENGPGFSTVLTQPGAYWGNEIPGPFESTSPDGCLTIRFLSDSSFQLAGFLASVTCQPILPCAKPANFDLTGTTSFTASFTFDEGTG
ncbi:MAG: adhesin, partial [Sphingobacteriales bacterium]